MKLAPRASESDGGERELYTRRKNDGERAEDHLAMEKRCEVGKDRGSTSAPDVNGSSIISTLIEESDGCSAAVNRR